MARNPIPALLAALAIAAGLAACGEKEETVSGTTTSEAEGDFTIAGDWSGQLAQKGLDPFLVAVRIEDPSTQKPTQVAYTGINCGGEWHFDGLGRAEPAVYLFTEQITTGEGGNCKGSGKVTLTSDDAAPEQLSYVFNGGGVQSIGVLTKTGEAGIAPTFAQAGVTLDP